MSNALNTCKTCAHFDQSPSVMASIADTDGAHGGCLKWMEGVSETFCCPQYRTEVIAAAVLQEANQ
ncbi:MULTISPECIES: hypothetical protein [Cyanophyceae]|uniref:hypothetical protein n=1 Tax=Cyanophyceae TaxID=3028117 RepID=UPI00168807F8|nr:MULTISPECIES: hypothetical protein [Cyanophyceae]MBD1918879.1 hypothetical protein [Phormidium sp. FACHB-77]MBD2033279.1 hypothetical protein [Phormidium sp. FACHB-322]MBD2053788.1 hypothetical protein [Leptolyngbya sp. FACHB-60]